LPELCLRIGSVVESVGGQWEVVFVNDGSTDASLDLLLELRQTYPFIRVVDLSRNFGHQPALTAGLDHATGDAIVMMDADLQDLPEAIPQFIERWKAGYEVVYAVRTKRKEGPLMRTAFRAFYELQTRTSRVKMPPHAGIFSLIDRKVLQSLQNMPERHRYLAGLRAYAGFRQVGIEVERGRRHHGEPKVGVRGLVRLAFDGIFAFSTYPLRLVLVSGFVISFASLIVGLTGLYYRFVLQRPMLSWPFGLTTTFFFGGIQLISIGIIGEYVGRIYDEVKRRPYYITRATHGFEGPGRDSRE
jgi:dolichol-phosphate mannosyltransferase